MTAPIVAPSLLAADFAHLGDEAILVEQDADWLHIDVMDNHFVPNLTIGLPVVQSLRAVTRLPFDVHLMIDEPRKWAPAYADAGAYNVTFHAEACDNPVALAKDLRSAGVKAGLAIDRDTPVEPYLEILPSFDTLLIMTIKAGFGGQRFLPQLLDKVRKARGPRRRGPPRPADRGRRRDQRRHHRAGGARPAPTRSSPGPPLRGRRPGAPPSAGCGPSPAGAARAAMSERERASRSTTAAAGPT